MYNRKKTKFFKSLRKGLESWMKMSWMCIEGKPNITLSTHDVYAKSNPRWWGWRKGKKRKLGKN
jgi:hypothetical protein